MKIRRLLALLLVLAMAIVPLFITSCAQKDDDDDDDDEEYLEESDLPPSFNGEIEKKFRNKKFTVLTREDRAGTQAFNIVDLVETKDELGDSSIRTAVANRNATIKDNLKIRIERDDVPTNQLGTHINTALNSNDTTYGAIMNAVGASLSTAASTGRFVDFNSDVSYINLEESWWDSAVIENLLLYDGAYIALGDINTVDDDATWCVLFNKQLYERNTGKKSSTLYQTVKDGQWTVSTLRSLASGNYSKDNNVRDKWLPSYAGTGTYGLYAQSECATVFLQAGKMTPSRIPEGGGIPVDNISGNDDFFTAVNEIYSLMGGTASSEWYVDITTDVDPRNAGTYGDKWETVARGGFKTGRALFFMCHVGTIDLIRDMTADFGILPIPKLNVAQEEYGNTIQYNNALCYSVYSRYATDKNADDLSAYVLEAMAYYSSPAYFDAIGADDKSLRHEYRETVLNTKATRDDESAEMLDYVFNNRVFDIACALNLLSINGLIQGECIKDTQSNMAGVYQSSIEGKLTLAFNEKLEMLRGVE